MEQGVIELKDDMLEGATAIAGFMGWHERRVYYFMERRKQGLPVEWPIFKADGQIWARKSALLAFIQARESESVGAPRAAQG